MAHNRPVIAHIGRRRVGLPSVEFARIREHRRIAEMARSHAEQLQEGSVERNETAFPVLGILGSEPDIPRPEIDLLSASRANFPLAHPGMVGYKHEGPQPALGHLIHAVKFIG
jgi:hypothetical protein